MAPDVIDLVSSSPPLSPLNRPTETAAPSTATGEWRNNHRRLRSPELFVSSDFDIPDDELLGQSPRNAKRLRISTSPSPRPAADPSRATQPPFISTTSSRPNHLEFDPIDFTSSIAPDTPKPPQNTIGHSVTGAPAARPHVPKQTAQTPLQVSLNSDPFASSPPLAPIPSAKQRAEKPEKPEKWTTTIADEFADAFASSPLPPLPPPSREPHKPREQATALHTILDVDEFSDPFLSSQNANLHQPTKIPTPRRAVSIELVEHSRKRRHWDPISSSAPEEIPRASPQKKTPAKSQSTGPTVISIDSDSADSSEDEFPDIADFNLSRVRPRPRSPIRRSQSDIITSRSNRPRSTATAPAPAKTAEQRARERDAKAAEKERKRLEKEQLKEAKALEKERAAALAEVNKVRTDKKVSTPEMILVIPSSVTEGLKVQLGTLLDGLSVEHTTWDSPVANIFKWRRKVISRFDEEVGRWEPIPLRIMPENHALILLTAEDFVEMAVRDTLDSSVSETKSHFPGHELIYILEGITPWMRKNRNLRNRRFAAGVRAQDQAAAPEAASASSRRRRNNTAAEEYISESIIEDAMLQLQVEHEVLIHHTAAPLETAQWIVAFTQHISTIPYKKLREKLTSSAGFCMESGQVRTGDDARDTYVRMLQEIARVTAPIAYGIVSEFDTVSKLVMGLEQGGPLKLESVRKSANKDGAVSDRTVGQAVSRRIHKVFTGKDEMSTDV